MDLHAKIRTIPADPGVYLYKNAEGDVIYVGKAKNLRSRVASYFHEGRWEDAKTGTLVREAVEEKLRTPLLTFAEVLAPVHEDFRRSGLSEAEVDALLDSTLAEVRKERRERQGQSS